MSVLDSVWAGERAGSWLVSAACFGLSFLTVGLHRSAGVLYVAVLAHFGGSREAASWPFSLCGALMCLLGPVAGFLQHHFSIRCLVVAGVLVSALAVALCFFTTSLLYLVVFFGFFRGVGNGLVVTLNPVLIHKHFSRRQATATGIAYAGASVGSFALPPLLEWLVNKFGMRGALLLLGGILLNGLVPALAAGHEPPKSPTHTKVPSSEEEADLHVVENNAEGGMGRLILRKVGALREVRAAARVLSHPAHLTSCVTFGACVLNFIAFLTVLVDFGRDRGLEEGDAALLVSYFSIGDLIGAVALGPLADHVAGRWRPWGVAGAFGALSALMACLPLAASEGWILQAACGCVGLCTGLLMANVPVLMRSRLGVERLAVAIGLGHFCVGVGQLIFPTLIGHFRDTVGSYDHLFSTLAGMCGLCSLMWLLEPLWIRLKPLEEENKTAQPDVEIQK